MTAIILIAYAFTSEIYNTSLRVTGLSFSSIVNRTGGILITWIAYGGFSFIGVFGPIIILAIFSLISTISVLYIPADTAD
mmetsp:Transcript_2634/g.244  ORF Transcript_2634/g.244 Transcript_2634/m.244 type:complete len:80 (-) Transcript_2634:27-266(-)